MKYLLTAEQMQRCDANTMDAGYGIPSAVLMERAALAVTEEITAACPDSSAGVIVACGTGNNGGDGLAIARLLYLKGYSVTVVFPGNEEKCSTECARQLGILKQYIGGIGKDIPAGSPAGSLCITDEIPQIEPEIIIDALFGIGLARDIGGRYRTIIDELNEMDGFKAAVDIPSGISADTGIVMGTAFHADMTVTFGFAKIGQIIFPGAGYCGKLIVKDMGIDENSFTDAASAVRTAEPCDLGCLPGRISDSNKGTYGKLLIFAGSYNMAGAAAFSAKAAYRSGAGLVRVVTDCENREIIQTLVPEAILATYDAKTDMDEFAAEQLEWADAVVLGPGIGRSRQSEDMVRCVLREVRVPCLLDADALNIISDHLEWLDRAGSDITVTPHPGEMARLLAASVEEVKGSLLSCAEEFTERFGTVTVLKDARTVICTPEGTWINNTGNNGMATAGSGDVLTGIIGALLGQGADSEKASVLGVMIHGMAGDAAAMHTGKTSLMASDIIEGLCEVFKGAE